MRRGLIIFFAVMALIFSVVLCACEKDATITEEEIVDVTSLTTQTGIVIEGGAFKSNTQISLSEVRDEEELSDINQEIRVIGGNIYKAFDISLYQGNEKIENKQYLTFNIPTGVLRLQGLDLEQFRLFAIDQKGRLDILTTDGNENNTKAYKFSTNMPKYLVVVRIENNPINPEQKKPEQKYSYFKVEGKTPTLTTTGVREHYTCYVNGYNKYFDLDYNEISYEDTIIPEMSHNFVLKVNGEKKVEFTVQEDGDYFKANLSGVSLKKDDILSLTTNDEYAYVFTLYQKNSQYYTRNNFSKEGKILYDVDSADISLEMYKTSFGGTDVIVSGAKFDIYSDYWTSRELVEADANGKVCFKKLKAWPVMQLYLYEEREGYDCDLDGFTLSTELPTGTVYLYSKTRVAFQKQGYYDVEFDLNTKIVTVAATEDVPTMISGGNYGYASADNTYLYAVSSLDLKFVDGGMDWYSFIPKFLANSPRSKVFIYDSKRNPANGLKVAEDSKEYIRINETNTNTIEFIKEGSYNINIYDETYIVSVEYLGDTSPVYKADLKKPHNSKSTITYDFVTTDAENVLVLESNLLVYAGYTLGVYNDKDSTASYTKLEESTDAEFASGLSRLYFHKGGVYKVYFNTSTLKVNIELVRELTEDEILIPTRVYNTSAGLYYQRGIELIANENDDEEVCALGVIINDEDKNYDFEFDNRDGSNIDKTEYINDISLDGEYENYKISKPTNGLEYGILNITKAGTYNIYINKLTHVVRVEEVVAA